MWATKTRTSRNNFQNCASRMILGLEVLQARDVAAALVWTAAGDGVFWSDPNNWEEFNFNTGELSGVRHTPNPDDVLYFGSFGGPNVSSINNISDVIVESIFQNNDYTGSLATGGLTVNDSFVSYGNVELSRLTAGIFEVRGGSVLSLVTPFNRTVLDVGTMIMSGEATFIAGVAGSEPGGSVTFVIDSLLMGSGTTFLLPDDLDPDVTLDGNIFTTGTINLGGVLTVTGNYSQPSGELILLDDSRLIIQGSAPASLSGRTTVLGDATISASSVQVDGTAEMMISSPEGELDPAVLSIIGDLEIRSGRFVFADIFSNVIVSGNFSVFIGTLAMNIGIGEDGMEESNTFFVGGAAKLGPDDGVGGPSLELNVLDPITSPPDFNLISAQGGGTGNFDSISSNVTLLAAGWFVPLGSTTENYRVLL